MPLATIPALITFTFPATFTAAGFTVRWETLAGAMAALLALLLALVVARSTPLDATLPPDWPMPGSEAGDRNHLRADDLLYIAVAALPGAVLGGRIGYVLLHLSYYQANSGAMTDWSTGGLELSMAVVGATLTASIVTLLIGAPLGRWLHALALPTLFLLGAIKVAMVFGGSGQGMPSGFSLASRYLGPGPWGSLAPEVASWPSQAMEAVATLLAGGLAWWLMAVGVFRRRNGAAFFLAVGLWAVARAIVATTWRDPAVISSLSAGQVLALGLAGACALLVVGFAAWAAAGRARGRDASGGRPTADGAGAEPSWPTR